MEIGKVCEAILDAPLLPDEVEDTNKDKSQDGKTSQNS